MKYIFYNCIFLALSAEKNMYDCMTVMSFFNIVSSSTWRRFQTRQNSMFLYEVVSLSKVHTANVMRLALVGQYVCYVGNVAKRLHVCSYITLYLRCDYLECTNYVKRDFP